MRRAETSAYELAQRFVGTVYELEEEGRHHPFIQWCFSLCAGYSLHTPDEVPWCSAFMQHPFWELRLPRSKSAAARSWLTVGEPLPLEEAEPGFDVVILKRGGGNQPGPEVLAAPGHVGLFGGLAGDTVLLLAGNQGNAVSVEPFPISRVLGVRRML
jgi:uncharacterized protein (TIGR02594 family)